MIQFLFRKSRSSRAFVPNTDHPREEKSSKQWTNKLASLVEDFSPTDKAKHEQELGSEGQTGHPISSTHHTSLRLEGPYFTPANPGFYKTVICLVAGTGISGAIAIAAAFSAQSATECEQAIALLPALSAEPTPKAETTMKTAAVVSPNKTTSTVDENRPPFRNHRTWNRCIIIWNVREADYIQLPFFKESETPGLEIRTHLTGQGHARLDMEKAVSEICGADGGGGTWCYLSGPNAFIEVGEKACRKVGVEYYGARWS